MKSVLSQKSNVAFGINIFLSSLIVILNLIILWGMFGPRISLAVETTVADEPSIVKVAEKKPTENRLVIPKLHLDEKITEGPTEAALNNGAWRIPSTSNPQLGGNTVLAGHRFTYRGASIFYNLDKVKIGDEIGASYNGDVFNYKVKEIVIVDPSNSEILAPTNEPTLTLYTCTPLWTTQQRLVIISELVGGPQ